MPKLEPSTPPGPHRRRSFLALGIGAVAIGMVGLSYAAVPLYKIFCARTGFAGTPLRSEHPSATVGARRFSVSFDSNVASDLPWSLEPETTSIIVQTGKTATVYFKVVNRSDRPTVGQASYNVSPDVAGEYFVKLACFCFSTQHLGPRETAEWPVVFYVDPAAEKDETMKAVDALTLSYTMFSVKTEAKPVADGRPGAPSRL